MPDQRAPRAIYGQAIKATLVSVAAFLIAGCSVKQLQDNTLDIGGSIGSIYTSQVLENINNLYNDPNAIPSIFSIPKGTIKTSNSVTPGVTIPLGNQVTRVVAVGGVTQSLSSFNGLSLQTVEAWEQSWDITPEKNPEVLRILRAIYLYALGTPQSAETLANAVPSDYSKTGAILEDFKYHCKTQTAEPGCFKILPTVHCVQRDIRSSTVMLASEEWVCLGKYGSSYDRLALQREMVVSSTAYQKGVLFDLVMFSLQIQADAEAANAKLPPSTNAASASANPAAAFRVACWGRQARICRLGRGAHE